MRVSADDLQISWRVGWVWDKILAASKLTGEAMFDCKVVVKWFLLKLPDLYLLVSW